MDLLEFSLVNISVAEVMEYSSTFPHFMAVALSTTSTQVTKLREFY